MNPLSIYLIGVLAFVVLIMWGNELAFVASISIFCMVLTAWLRPWIEKRSKDNKDGK